MFDTGEWVEVPSLGMGLRVAEDGGEGPYAAEACRLGVRPENVLLSEDGARCVVEHTQALGSHNMLSLRCNGGGKKENEYNRKSDAFHSSI